MTRVRRRIAPCGAGSVLGFGIGYAVNLAVAGLRLHRICDPEVAAGCGESEYSDSRVVNANRLNALGDPISGEDQRGVRVAVMQAATEPLFVACVKGFTWNTSLPRPLADPNYPTFQMTPNETAIVEVYRDAHEKFGDAQTMNDCGHTFSMPFTAAEIRDAISMTIGHETGHAVHLCHTREKASGGSYYECPEDIPGSPGTTINVTNPIRSVMASELRRPVPQVTDLEAQYSSSDIRQIRLHVRR